MIILRFIQGLTGGAGAVISRAIASDMYSGNALTKFLSLLMLVNGIAPIIAPALGGIILNYGPWRIVFVILTMFGIVMLIGTLFKVPESLEKSLRESSNIGTMLINFKELFKTPRFVLPMLIQGVSFVLLFTYISASPFYSSNNLWFNAIKLQYYVCFYRRYTHYFKPINRKTC